MEAYDEHYIVTSTSSVPPPVHLTFPIARNQEISEKKVHPQQLLAEFVKRYF